MLANFKGKANTNGFSQNKNGINRKGRPPNIHNMILEEALRTGDIDTASLTVAHLIRKRLRRLSLKDLVLVQNVCFLHWYILKGGDLDWYKEVYKL